MNGNAKVLRRKGKSKNGKETRGTRVNPYENEIKAYIREKNSGIERELKTNVYFADPYCAWQKGTNENLNGLLREFYPKGRNLARVSAKTLAQNVTKINNRSKKVLNFQTPADLFEQELQKVLHLT